MTTLANLASPPMLATQHTGAMALTSQTTPSSKAAPSITTCLPTSATAASRLTTTRSTSQPVATASSRMGNSLASSSGHSRSNRGSFREPPMETSFNTLISESRLCPSSRTPWATSRSTSSKPLTIRRCSWRLTAATRTSRAART